MTPPLLLLACVAALGAVWLAGAALSALAGIREGRLRDVPLDMALGSTLLALAGSATVIAGWGLTLPFAAGLLGAPVLAALAAGRLRLRMAAPLPSDPVARALLALTALVLVVVITAAMRDRLTWDGWAFWTLKATMLFRDGTLPADLFDPAGPYDYAHADYPPGLPLLYWWVFRLAGAPAPALASFTGALWMALLAALFWDSARAHAAPVLAALGALAVAAFWPIGRYATGGQADVLIALAALGVTVHLVEAATSAGDGAWWRAAAFAAFAAVMKNEGLALAAVVALAGAGWLVYRRAVSPRRLLALGLPIALALPWLLWVRTLGLEAAHLEGGVGLRDLPGRMLVIARALAELAVHRSWVPVAPIAAMAVALALRGRSTTLALRLPAAVLALYFGATLIVYLRAPLDLAWLLDTSLERIVGGLVPAVAFVAVVGTAHSTDVRAVKR